MNQTTSEKQVSPLGRMAIDFGPIVAFFATNSLLPSDWASLRRIMAATAVFMVATVAAMIYSRLKAGKISPMLFMSGALVLVFGGLTLWFHNDTFIKVKPTIVYSMFAAILAFGLATGRPLLKMLLESAYPGLTPEGWRKLTINWTFFFVAMAILNEIVWRNSSFNFWLGFKVWGAIPLTLLFAMVNIPMLLRNGMSDPSKPAPVPPEG
ncbi:intracellular septation protein [Sphingomonas zeicaulis]|uniref:septation protein A n=1 Tax=Sphingomonas zeicaulis TaxID=1632740 RepID=UPI003D1B3D47